MYLKQFYLGCLAHASYLLGSHGEAVVIDPQRDVDQYIEEARKEGLSIKYIIETHLHADFVSGHRELAEKSGAEIVFGAKAGATFPHLAVSNGDVLKIGTVDLSILETPGHTPESICILAKDTATEEAAKLFSGDTLFIGDVGRPDLVGSKGYTEREMASLMYDSLHEKLLNLADGVEVLPAHGAGSLCGKHLSNEKSSTIGLQKQFNYALKPMAKEAFITMLTADLPEVPAYFPKDVEINRHGALPIEELARPKSLKAAEVNKAMQDGTVVLDIRSGVEFAGGHIKGSLNIGLSGQFASWAGTLLELGKPVILVATDAATIDEAVVRLARIGIETVVGYQENGMLGWSDGGFEVVESLVITVDELKKELDAGEQYQILDVRRTGEYQGGHVPSAINVPLAELPGRLKEVPTGSQIAVICASGYRSSIAKSVLERAGFKPLLNVLGGTAAWKNAGYELEQKEASVV